RLRSPRRCGSFRRRRGAPGSRAGLSRRRALSGSDRTGDPRCSRRPRSPLPGTCGRRGARHPGHSAPHCRRVQEPDRVRIWVDLENLPDVPFFAPILRALESEGHRIHLTARRERDLTELCARKGWRLDALVGRHYRRSRLLKTAGGLVRALGLVRAVRAFRPDLLVNFTSRPPILAAAALRAPSFPFFDYEHVALPLVGRLSGRVCVPEAAAHAAAARLGLPE